MAQSKSILGAVAGLAFVGLLLGIAWRSQRTLELGLPPRTVAASQTDAFTKAQLFAAKNGGQVVAVLGTGSMAPFIPAGDANAIVAYAVTRAGATFADVTPGAVCLYRHGASPVGVTMHGAAKLTAHGWVMSGLHNAVSDEWMTRASFVGIAAHVFVGPQE